MPSRIDRLATLEQKATPPIMAGLIIFVDGPEPSAEQFAQIEQAKRDGRPWLCFTRTGQQQ